MNKVSTLRLALLVTCLGLATSCTEAGKSAVSDIKKDETVVFFRTAAWSDESGDSWYVPIHGWIYETEDSTARREVFESILEKKYDLVVSDASTSNFANRINLMIADNERGKEIVIALAGREYALPRSSANGQFETTLEIPATEIEAHARHGLLTYSAVTASDESRQFDGNVRLIGPAGLSVISDIDDTVKISNVTDHKNLLDYTFLKDFVAAPGMAELYQQWASQGASFHFVSSSPWQLYSPLQDFLDDTGFKSRVIQEIL